MNVAHDIKLAVIGTGYWGKNHVRVLNELGLLAAVYDSDQKSCEPYEIKFGLPKTNWDDIMNDGKIDGVVIATPYETHYEIAKRALQKGKHVLVEKPTTNSFYQASELQKLAEERGKVLMTGYQMLHHGAMKLMLKMVKEGVIGEVKDIKTFRSKGRFEDIIWGEGPHDASIVLEIMDELPQRVLTVGQKDEIANITVQAQCHMEFANNARVTASFVKEYPTKMHQVIVTGTLGSIVFSDSEPVGKKLKMYGNQATKENNGINYGPMENDGGQYIVIEMEEPLLASDAAFLKKVQTNDVLDCGFSQGPAVIRLLEAMVKSNQSDSKWIYFDT